MCVHVCVHTSLPEPCDRVSATQREDVQTSLPYGPTNPLKDLGGQTLNYSQNKPEAEQ